METQIKSSSTINKVVAASNVLPTASKQPVSCLPLRCCIGVCAGFEDNCVFLPGCVDTLWGDNYLSPVVDKDSLVKAMVQTVEMETYNLAHIQHTLRYLLDRRV